MDGRTQTFKRMLSGSSVNFLPDDVTLPPGKIEEIPQVRQHVATSAVFNGFAIRRLEVADIS